MLRTTPVVCQNKLRARQTTELATVNTANVNVVITTFILTLSSEYIGTIHSILKFTSNLHAKCRLLFHGHFIHTKLFLSTANMSKSYLEHT